MTHFLAATNQQTNGASSARHDAWRIMAARGPRSFAYGMLAVLPGVALSVEGLSLAALGALITVSPVGDFCGTYLIGVFADRWGRRRTLFSLALVMAHQAPASLFAHFPTDSGA
jgi:MFS family permease